MSQAALAYAHDDPVYVEIQAEQVSLLDRWGPWLVGAVGVSWFIGMAVGFQTALAILTAGGFAMAVLFLPRPSVALLGVSILCTLDSVSRTYLMTGGLLRWNTLNYWLALFLVMAVPALFCIRELPSLFLLAYAGMMVFDVAFTEDRLRGVLDVLNMVGAIGVLGYFMRARRDAKVWYWMGIVNGFSGVCGGLVYYVQKAGLPKIDENGLSYFPLTAMFAICIAFPFAARADQKKILCLLAAVNLLWVFLTGSRQGLLVGSTCCLFLISQLPGLGNRVLVLAAAIALGFGIFNHFTELQERSIQRMSKMFDDRYSMAGRTSGRYDLYLGAWRIFEEHPMGVGTGGFPRAWAKLADRKGLSGFVQGREFNCHSGWLKALTENGIIGFTLLVCFVASFGVVGWLRGNRIALRLGLLATVVLTLAFVATEFQVKGTWFLAAGVSVLLSRPIIARFFTSEVDNHEIVFTLEPELHRRAV